MWPTGPLLVPIPDSFQTFEDKHLLELRCRNCKQTVAMFSAGARPELILEATMEHRCLVNGAIPGIV